MLDFLSFLLKNWRIVVGCTACGVLAFGFHALITPPIYRAVVVVSPADMQPDVGMSALGAVSSMAGLAGIDLGSGQARKREAVAILSSSRLARDFIARNNLLPAIFSDRWDNVAQRWSNIDDDLPPSVQQGAELFVEEIVRVIEDNRTGLVTVSIDWQSPDVAANWANRYIELANEIIRNKYLEEATAATTYLMAELDRTNAVELREAIFAVIESRLKEQVMANVRRDYAFRVIDPAFSDSRDKPIKPKLLLSLVAGAFVGLIIGIILASDLDHRRRRSKVA